MKEEDITSPALGEASQLNAAPAGETVGNVSGESLSLKEISETLGKEFPTKEAALKSFKDTFAYVGKKKEDIQKEVLSSIQENNKTDQLARELEEMRKERFYDKNPQYADASIRKFIESTGKNPAEVVNAQEFKDIFQKISGYDETQKLKTVLESNPRLASSKDSLSKAREVQAKSGTTPEVENLAVRAVMDAYEM